MHPSNQPLLSSPGSPIPSFLTSEYSILQAPSVVSPPCFPSLRSAATTPADLRHLHLPQVLLRWNLEMHEQALEPILGAFKSVDTRGLGYLLAPQFTTFCHAINPAVSDEQVAVLLESLAPGPVKQVTFSSCAFVLGAELSRMRGYS
jgi:hypothetical protein